MEELTHQTIISLTLYLSHVEGANFEMRKLEWRFGHRAQGKKNVTKVT